MYVLTVPRNFQKKATLNVTDVYNNLEIISKRSY